MDPKQQLEAYIKSQLDAGISTDVILASIRPQGWTEQDLNSILAKLSGVSPNLNPLPAPKRKIFKTVFILVILLALIGGGAYLGLSKNSPLQDWVEEFKSLFDKKEETAVTTSSSEKKEEKKDNPRLLEIENDLKDKYAEVEVLKAKTEDPKKLSNDEYLEIIKKKSELLGQIMDLQSEYSDISGGKPVIQINNNVTDLDEKPVEEKKTETQNSDSSTITFGGRTYKVGFEMPAASGPSAKVVGKEWVASGESVENWTRMITTVKITPIKSGETLSYQEYAENLFASLEEKQAIFGGNTMYDENFVAVSTTAPDPKNPTLVVNYLLEYPTENVYESNFHMMKPNASGGVDSILYAEKVTITGQADFTKYVESAEHKKKMLEIAKLKMPY